MDTQFHYRRISEAFHQEAATLVSQDQCVALLGLRNIGKSYALKVLADQLSTDASIIVVKLCCFC